MTEELERPLEPISPVRPRRKWSANETSQLVAGCYKHGVGAWQTILKDPAFHFEQRTAVDLKDKFRVLFPDEYGRLYASKSKSSPARNINNTHYNLFGQPPSFKKVTRRRKSYFSPEEDADLKRGVEMYGRAWAKIANDVNFGLTHRKSTDLRDRFRNAFPEEYAAFGFRPKKKYQAARPVHSALEHSSTLLSNGISLQHDGVPPR